MGLCGTATGSSLSVDEPDELCARYIVLHAVVKVRWTSAVGVQVREVHFKFISSSLDCFTENARTSGHELLVELCASDSVYWPLFTGADFLGAMGVVAPI